MSVRVSGIRAQDGITWLLLPPHKSLALLLADNGFDVWIANTRGTKYSRGHVSLTPTDAVKFPSLHVGILDSLLFLHVEKCFLFPCSVM